jgi:hypothetical protein
MKLPTQRIRKAFAFGLPASIVALTLLAAPAAVSAATLPITFDMDMFGSCVAGNAGDGATIKVVWRNSSGALKLSGNANHPYGGGYFEFCAPNSSTALMPGDKLKVSDGSYARNYVVPNLTLHLDRVNDRFTGTGPAGRTIRLCLATGDFERCHSVRVATDGNWSYDWDDDLIHYSRGFGASLKWTSPNGDRLNLYDVNAPYVAVSLGKAKFSGETDPRGAATVLLNGNASGPVVGDGRGYFNGTFRDSHGHAVKVMPGDRVHAPSIASDLDWIVPQVDGSATASTDVVSGRCYDAGTSAHIVTIDVYRTGKHRGFTSLSTEPDGSFSIDMRRDVGHFFEDSANVKPGDRVVIGCVQTTGDVVQLEVKAV